MTVEEMLAIIKDRTGLEIDPVMVTSHSVTRKPVSYGGKLMEYDCTVEATFAHDCVVNFYLGSIIK